MEEAPTDIDTVHGDEGKKGKHVKGKNGKDNGEGKHKGKRESRPEFEGFCGLCGKWKHKQRQCLHKNPVADMGEEPTVIPPNNGSNASGTTNRVPPGLSAPGIPQMTAGISG